MENFLMISDIQKKADGSYIINYNGMPYHAVEAITRDVYQQVLAEIESGAVVTDYIEPEPEPLTEAEKIEAERRWAMSELARSDRCKTDDYPLNGLTREELLTKVDEYREKLRNPQRSNHAAFPDISWRPEWPERVKRPAV